MGLFDGLFGSKKPDKTAKVSDFFSADDLAKILETMEAKLYSNGYGKYSDMARTLVSAANNPDMTVSTKELGRADGLLFAVGTATKMEPSLKPILSAAVEKMRAFRNS